MSDQSQTAGAEELTTTSAIGSAGTESETTTTELETAIGETPEGEEGGEEDLDDLEFAFGKYRVPKKLAEGVKDLQSTFTKKTQEYSSKAGELEAREARLAEQSKVNEEELGHRATLRNIDAQLEQYSKYTEQQWAGLKQEDHDSWTEHRFHLQALRDQRHELTGVLSQAEAKRTQEAQSATTKRIEDTQAHAMKIKGWTKQMDADVVEYAISKGYTADKVAELLTPAMYDVLRFARIGEQTLKQHAAPKPSTPETPAEPLEMVGAKKNPPPAGLNDALSTEEWIKRREKQVKARA